MIKILKEAEVTGKAKFIPTPDGLKELSDTALEMTADNADKLDNLKKAVDVIMMSLAELQEAQDTNGGEDKPTETVAEGDK